MMIPEAGLFALILSVVIALIFSVRPSTIGRTSIGALLFTSILAFVLLMFCFIRDDFTVLYVANNSNSTLSWYYKLTALWGAHEGSMLLWYCILTTWLALYACLDTSPEAIKRQAIRILSVLTSMFGAFIIFLSNPFERHFFPVIKDGLDLNPLLQDIGFIIHPPILYLGYVGMALPFAIAASVLLCKAKPEAYLSTIRHWLLVPLAFLTLGIALGSWWAYYELGWGGWWFWDPVENAALIPWLTGIALLHTCRASKTLPQMTKLTYWLALFCSVFAVLGTFLVRSGIVSSVHSFASDPQRGIVLLIFVGLMTIFCFWLMLRSDQQFPSRRQRFPVLTPSFYALVSGMIFFISALIVLLGTVYPILTDTVFDTVISIGPPYYNQTVIPGAPPFCDVL